MNKVDEIGILRQSGLRCTPQRVAIVREVFTRRHPTAYEVYESVRRYFPTIGLATVYNTLRTMTQRGIVAELPFSSEMRFDANMTRANASGESTTACSPLVIASSHLPAAISAVAAVKSKPAL